MKVSFWIYIFILIFAPLAFATAELWSMGSVEVLTGVAAVLFFGSRLFFKEEMVRVPGLVPLVLLLIFMGLQLIPLPAYVVKIVAPASFEAYDPILSLSGSSWIPISINQNATLQELLRIGCYSLFYILTVQLLSIQDHLKKTVFIVIGLAAFIALLAIIQRVGSPDKIYWFRAVPDNAHPFGPWINPNQFAGFMEMLCPLALGLFLFFKPRVPADASLRYKIVNFFTMPSSNLYMFLGLATSLMFLSVFVSLCRGGILTITLAVLVFIILYSIKKARQGRAAIFIIVCCVAVAVSWFGWDSVIAEFNNGVNADGQISDGRFLIWTDTVRIFQSFFIFGSGFGTFIDIFPSYMSFPGFGIVDHAHNDYLELLTDGGIIGFGLAAWFVCSVVLHGWNMIQARRDQYSILLGIGALTGIIAMLMHSVTDFNMHNGADGLYFFFSCGLLVAVTNIRFLYCDTQSVLPKRPFTQVKYFLIPVCLFTALAGVIQYGALRAQWSYNEVANIFISQRLKPTLLAQVKENVHRAQSLAPLNFLYPYKLGSIANIFDNNKEAENYFVRSARLNPFNGSALQNIGFLTANEDMAMALLQKGYERGLDDDDLALNYISYLLTRDERSTAIQVMVTRLQRSPSLFPVFVNMFDIFSFSRTDIAAVFADSVDLWFKYASALEKQGEHGNAELYFQAAFNLLANAETIKPQWFHQLIGFYKKNEQPERALLMLRKAVATLPDNISFHLQLGDHYRNEGITFRAKEEYERVLMLQPGNRAAEKRLRSMGLMDSY